jgi:asparagine synthase (glutamine-hydrolysing)
VYETDGHADPDDESSWAELALYGHDNSDLHRVPAAEGDWIDTLRRIVWHMDGPGFSPAVFPLWNIARQARADGVKVLLEGQGADELLGGYSSHTAAALLDGAHASLSDRSAESAYAVVRALHVVPESFAWRRVGADVAVQLAPPLQRWDRRRGTVAGALKQNLSCWVGSNDIADPFSETRDRLGKCLLADFSRDLLPAFLHYEDAITMAHSVESRLPFINYRVRQRFSW